MSRRVVLVDLPWSRNKDPRIPLGHASLLAALRANTGAEVRSVVCPANAPGLTAGGVVGQILDEVGDAPPPTTDVAIGVYVWGEHLIGPALTELRARGFSGRIILGGPQISYAGSGVDRLYPAADIFVRGYGEVALCELAEGRGHRTPGVHYGRMSDMATQTQVDLQSLPSPWLTGALPLAGQRFIRWETQRGCPFRCAFCQHREPGDRLLRRDLHEDRVFAEADLFCASGVEDIAVLDPIFNSGPTAISVLERFARQGFRGRLSLQCRLELVKPSFLLAASQLRTRLEFGLQTIHETEGRAVDRRNHMGRVADALALVRDSKIDHEVSLIFGLPTQTLESFLESVDWCLARGVPVIRAFPLMLLRGTGLERERATWGLVDDGTSMPKVIESTTFDQHDWYRMAQVAEALSVTEHHHPRSVRELISIADTLRPVYGRWQPPSQFEAHP